MVVLPSSYRGWNPRSKQLLDMEQMPATLGKEDLEVAAGLLHQGMTLIQSSRTTTHTT